VQHQQADTLEPFRSLCDVEEVFAVRGQEKTLLSMTASEWGPEQ
jgi:hypothetical protein